MVFFLAFLVITTIFVPMFPLSRSGRLALSFIFALTLISGALVTIRHRSLKFLVVILTLVTVTADLVGEFARSRSFPTLETALKLSCLAILVTMTLRQTFRPGPVTIYRVMGGIAGYLLIGFTWSFAYQLVLQQVPNAIHFASAVPSTPFQQSTDLTYFSFVTLSTVGYGDAYPVHPAMRSLAVAETLVGQLYLAILIGSLVGMALQARSEAGGHLIPDDSSPDQLKSAPAERTNSSIRHSGRASGVRRG
jgi:hypothetical protein